ncbi:MAG: putative transporter substrate-binding protein [Hyphomicrobiales bacterium]|nr:putative transporter substrate-binding protein [Hyphomicrobiales bacterium]
MEVKARYVAVGLFTLVVAVAALLSALWLRGTGSLGAQRQVDVLFATQAPGLRVGAPVSFNGVRVGEVQRLSFDARHPAGLRARLSVSADAPLSASTQVSLDTQGLMGSTVVSLSGGEGAPLAAPRDGGPVVLNAPGARSLTEEARRTLSQFQEILGDNADPVREVVANIQSFSAALARNSDKVDTILSGLERMTGGADEKKEAGAFDLVLPQPFEGLALKGEAQLIVADPTVEFSRDTQRFLLRKPDGQVTMQTGRWADSIPKLVQRKVLQVFDGLGYRFASPPTEGLNADLQLMLEVRQFEVEEQTRNAVVELAARLVGKDGKVIDARVVAAREPAKEMDGAPAAQAMTAAFIAAARDLIGWYGAAAAKADQAQAQ